MIVHIPIADLKKPPILKFPEKCNRCGGPIAETLGMKLQMGVQYRGKVVALEMNVPMCKECADRERGIGKVTYIPFFVAGFIFGGIAFFPAMLIAPQGSDPHTVGFPFVIGGFAGLMVGSIAGTIAELVVKSMAIPWYGRLVTRRPLTVVALFSDTDELLGVSARLNRKQQAVLLEFENEEIAREFKQLNGLEN